MKDRINKILDRIVDHPYSSLRGAMYLCLGVAFALGRINLAQLGEGLTLLLSVAAFSSKDAGKVVTKPEFKNPKPEDEV